MKNLQGDIVGIVDANGNEVVRYFYEAWGKPTSKTGTMAGTLGTVQPFRYRGYVYDEETGLHYLRSRYSDSKRGRFISADSVILDINLFTYCKNKPIISADYSGHNSEWVFFLKHPIIALDIGKVIEGKRNKNISTTAAGFSLNMGLSNPSKAGGKGTQVNAVRHAMWVGIISSKYGDDIAWDAAMSHEDDWSHHIVNSLLKCSDSKISEMIFENRSNADSACDLLNNNLSISLDLSGLNAKEVAYAVLYLYHTEGLWVIDDDAFGYRIIRQRLSESQYSTAMSLIGELDEYGLSSQ